MAIEDRRDALRGLARRSGCLPDGPEDSAAGSFGLCRAADWSLIRSLPDWTTSGASIHATGKRYRSTIRVS
jgi:hypothetical protein